MEDVDTAGEELGQRIAVIGGGMAGLCAAWLLSQRYRVTLYERQAKPGLVASSVALPQDRATGGNVRVDVPLRVFYPGYYPALTALYRRLGVDTEPVSYAASFAGDDGRLYFRYRNLRLGSASIGWLAPQDLLGRRARRIVAGLLRFHGEAPRALREGGLEGLTLGEYVAQQGYRSDFVDRFLLPAAATVCTCSYSAVRAYPAAVIVDYLVRGLTRQSVRRAVAGADDVARRLVAGLAELRCDAAITAIRRGRSSVSVFSDGVGEEHYDHVVLATQANQAQGLLHDASAAETAMLTGFRYQPVLVAMHRDSRLMPPRRADWSPVNLQIGRAFDRPMSTIWINAVQPALRRAPPLFQTVQPWIAPRDELLIAQARFERPVVDARSRAAVSALARLHGESDRRIWFCGSYAQAGIPLLESAVVSALAVARAMGVPWPGPMPPGLANDHGIETRP